MKLTLRQQLTQFAHVLQSELFPAIAVHIGALDERAKRLVACLEMLPLERFLPAERGWVGRPCKDRYAIAAAFVAKAVYGFATTRQLLENLQRDATLRRICGWESAGRLPHESTFSRAFDEFAAMQLPQFVHEGLIRESQKDRLIGHIARDSTAIEAREHFPDSKKIKRSQKNEDTPRAKVPAPSKNKPGGPPRRWKGGKPRRAPNMGTRLARQRSMTLSDMLAELPQQCDIGAKTNSVGHTNYWRGYKLHLDVADGQIPISAVLSSASVHDSQVAIPLATLSSQRVRYCYELMDAAYDAQHIQEHSKDMGHVAIIDPAAKGRKSQCTQIPLGRKPRQLSWAEEARYRERTMVERVYGRLKDEFGGRQIRVRGARKIMAHLMFGLLALTVDQLLRLVL